MFLRLRLKCNAEMKVFFWRLTDLNDIYKRGRQQANFYFWFYCLPRYFQENVTIFFGLFRSKTGRSSLCMIWKISKYSDQIFSSDNGVSDQYFRREFQFYSAHLLQNFPSEQGRHRRATRRDFPRVCSKKTFLNTTEEFLDG